MHAERRGQQLDKATGGNVSVTRQSTSCLKNICFFKKKEIPCYNAQLVGSVAQLVEQRIENPRVGGSIPPRATNKINNLANPQGLAFLLVFPIWEHPFIHVNG